MRELNSGDVLGGRYTIISKLGGGGFGKTYIAQDMQRPGHPKCVVKQLKPENSHPQLLETALRLFNTEAEALELLGNHPQIPQLLAHFPEGEEFFVVQELINGECLSAELIPGQPWTEASVVQSLRDILKTLEFIHNNNVIHRDIKPDNIIRRFSDRKLVLVDFGSVKQIRGQLTYSSSGQVKPTVAIGTQGYMPAEQLGGKPRFSSDIYALGKIGIQAVTGLELDQIREDNLTGEIIWKPWARISDSLVEILERMVKYHFNARYQSAQEVLDALIKLEPSEVNMTSDSPTLNTESAPSNSYLKEEELTQPNSTVQQDDTLVQADNIAAEAQVDNTTENLQVSHPNPTLIAPHTKSDARNQTVVSPQPVRFADSSIPQFGARPLESPPPEINRSDFEDTLIGKLKLSGIFGAGGWAAVVCLVSLLSNLWIVSGAWLIIATLFVFVFFAREKQWPDKVLWLAVSIVCAILAVFIVPSSLTLGSLLSSGLLGVLAFLLIAIFSFSLVFIILALLDLLPD